MVHATPAVIQRRGHQQRVKIKLMVPWKRSHRLQAARKNWILEISPMLITKAQAGMAGMTALVKVPRQ
jgi:hypothetical protein